MRENNFRAWNARTGKILDGDLIESEPMISTGLSYGKLFVAETYHGDWRELTLMQSTGLRDKNGKEIYEGDIFSDEDGTFHVWWNEKVGVWAISDSDGVAEWLGDYNESYEIIGNIYENPELLTQ